MIKLLDKILLSDNVKDEFYKNYNDSEKQDNENDFQTFKNFFAGKDK